MYYEDVKIKPGDTISELIEKYGHKGSKWPGIWDDPKNSALKAKRGKPERIQAGDVFNIPIPWKITSKSVAVIAAEKRVKCSAERDGVRGTQLGWVQTVDQSNQAIGGTDQQCVDACPPDDADPFYWTSAELVNNPDLHKTFSDKPFRNPPSGAQGTTKWRAILSFVVFTEKRVTIMESFLWGFDLTPAGVLTAVTPRAITAAEETAHLALLAAGTGTGGAFSGAGWTFRKAA
jgi:hypothetical protein